MSGEISMKNTQLRKLTIAALFAALAVVCLTFSIPVGASKCLPVQHFVNIVAGVFLGPGYAVGVAFVTSLIRNLLGTGSLLAFPGSMCGAFLSGMLYKLFRKLPFAYIGELFGTSVIGGMISFPVATLIMSNEAALFTYVFPFFVSSCGGTIIAAILVPALKKAGVDRFINGSESKEKVKDAGKNA